MTDTYQSLRAEFRSIIEKNLASDFELGRVQLKPFRRSVYKNKASLVFYKYMIADYYSIRNIETDTLVLVNPVRFNDVFEGIPYFIDDDDLRKSDIIRDSAVITCFCEEGNDLLMFAHYAQSFTGMCVQYDFGLLDESSSVLSNLFPVLYEKEPSKLKGIDRLAEIIDLHYTALRNGNLSLHKLTDIISYFIHKPDVWAYENEWRIIIPAGVLDGAKKDIHFVRNFDCIKKVFLGYRMDKVKREHVLEIISKKNESRLDDNRIEVYDTNLGGNSYSLITNKVL